MWETESDEVIQRRGDRQRQMLLESFTHEMQALARMNPKAQLSNIEVHVKKGEHTYRVSIHEFLGNLCVDAFVRQYGEYADAERVEVRVL